MRSHRISAGTSCFRNLRDWMKNDGPSFLFRRYPELQLYADAGEIGEALTRAKHQASKSAGFWVRNALIVVVLFGAWIALEVVNKRRAFLPEWCVQALEPVSLFLWGGGAYWGYRSRVRRCVREDLVMRGIPICIPCGYDLRGQSEPRCPECGTPFDAALLLHGEAHTFNKSRSRERRTGA